MLIPSGPLVIEEELSGNINLRTEISASVKGRYQVLHYYGAPQWTKIGILILWNAKSAKIKRNYKQ